MTELERILQGSEEFYSTGERMVKFASKYGVTPIRESERIIEAALTLAGEIPLISNPQNQEDLLRAEIKKRLSGEANYHQKFNKGGTYSFEEVTELLGIERKEIEGILPWLLENKEKVEEAVRRLYLSKNFEEYELGVSEDIPAVRRQAEEVAGAYIEKYHQVLGRFLTKRTKVGEFMRDIRAQPTSTDRSYFDIIRKTLALAIPRICSQREDGTIDVKEGELIHLYGHEGMGHALQDVVTSSANIPRILKEKSFMITATAEAVAQFYEKVLLEDLRNHPEIQRKLGIEHKFEGIYSEAKDTEDLKKYQLNLFFYAVSVLADKGLGDPRNDSTLGKKIELIQQAALNKGQIGFFVQRNRDNFDHEGNLSASLVGELKYSSGVMEYALDVFRQNGFDYHGQGRDIIDKTLLTGFWTPQGFKDNARIIATQSKKDSD